MKVYKQDVAGMPLSKKLEDPELRDEKNWRANSGNGNPSNLIAESQKLTANANHTKEIRMSKVRVAGFGVTLDGFSAGADQSLENPLGRRGAEIFQWFFHTRTFCSMHGKDGGSVGDIDDQFAHVALDNFGAFILGRNMFGPIRGPWPDESWRGWWGENPPYHAPTFVLTHHKREPLVMEGGTTFYFVTGGIEEALERAKEAAGNKDVKIGGGVSTVRQYLKAGLIDSLHLASVPILLGQGEALFQDMDLRALGFSVTASKASENATHVTLQRI